MIGVDIEFNIYYGKRVIKPNSNIVTYYDGILIGADGSMECHEIRTYKTYPSLICMKYEIQKAINRFVHEVQNNYHNRYTIQYDLSSKFHPLGGHIHISYPLLSRNKLYDAYTTMKSKYQNELIKLHKYFSDKNMYKRKTSVYNSYRESLRYNLEFSTIEFRSIPSYYLMQNFVECITYVTENITKYLLKCV